MSILPTASACSGLDLITGETLSPFERGLTGLSAILPIVGGAALRKVVGGADEALSVADDIVSKGTTKFVADAEVTSFGRVVGRGTVDVRATVEGIESGVVKPRAIFQNRPLPGKTTPELPVRSPGYYRELAVLDRSESFAGRVASSTTRPITTRPSSHSTDVAFTVTFLLRRLGLAAFAGTRGGSASGDRESTMLI